MLAFWVSWENSLEISTLEACLLISGSQVRDLVPSRTRVPRQCQQHVSTIREGPERQREAASKRSRTVTA
jgi:hypothetical protein